MHQASQVSRFSWAVAKLAFTDAAVTERLANEAAPWLFFGVSLLVRECRSAFCKADHVREFQAVNLAPRPQHGCGGKFCVSAYVGVSGQSVRFQIWVS